VRGKEHSCRGEGWQAWESWDYSIYFEILGCALDVQDTFSVLAKDAEGVFIKK